MICHSHAEFEAMLASRRSANQPIAELLTYYHIACMNEWRPVVAEQLFLLHHAGVTVVHSFILGTLAEVLEIAAFCETIGITLKILGHADDFGKYETPTLAGMWRHAQTCPAAAFLYLHTKGVSAPGDETKKAWRRIMQKYLLENMSANIERLREFCLVGSNWQHNHDYPHYSGNFWMARADWLKFLPDPAAYRHSRNIVICGQPWARIHAEMWLGSLPFHHMYSATASNLQWWCGQDLEPFAIEGFDYARFDSGFRTALSG